MSSRASASLLWIIAFLATSIAARATDIYVDGLSGNDSSSTGAKAAPVLHFWRAMQLVHPGDTIHLLPTTTYLGLSIGHSGSPGLPITITGDGIAPNLTKVTTDSTASTSLSEYSKAIYVYNASKYVNISNLDVRGSGTAVFITKGSGHIGIFNSVLHDSGQAGVQTVGADYITITGNTVYNNAWDTTGGSFGSGISILESVDSDTNTTQPKIIISNNTIYHNYNLPRTPGESCSPSGDSCTTYNSDSDGNGIILDRNSGRTSTMATTASLTPYNGRFLVSGNVIFNNGGRGIHVYLSDHATIVNNTVYKNNQDPLESAWKPGEITTVNSGDDSIYNNVVYSSSPITGQNVGGHYGISIEYCIGSTYLVKADYNIAYNDLNQSDAMTFTGSGSSSNTAPVNIGAHNTWANPLFIAPGTDPTSVNFNVNLKSPAINAGYAPMAMLTNSQGAILAVPKLVQIGALAPISVGSNSAPSPTVKEDFTGAGRSDILVQKAATTELYQYQMNGLGVSSADFVYPVPGSGWSVVGTGYFTGGGHAAILLQNASTTQLYEYQMNGTTVSSGGYVSRVPGAGWNVVGIGDFAGRGVDDILFQNQSTTQLYEYQMSGTTASPGGAVSLTPGAGWSVVGVGDFNGDGKADILLQNASTTQLYEYQMNGTSVISGGFVSRVPGVGWKVVGTGDFDGDGKADILFQNTSTTQVYEYQMNGTDAVSGASLGIAGAGWNVVATGDYNGDGKADVLFQNTVTTAIYEWQMDGFAITSGAGVAIPGIAWSVTANR